MRRKHGKSQGTFYNWKAKFGGMTVSKTKRLKMRLAERTLDLAAMKELVAIKW